MVMSGRHDPGGLTYVLQEKDGGPASEAQSSEGITLTTCLFVETVPLLKLES